LNEIRTAKKLCRDSKSRVTKKQGFTCRVSGEEDPQFAYLCICQVFDHFGNGIIKITDLENLGVDTIFIMLSHVCGELWPKNGISVMAALICILPKTLKGARVASSGFLISTLRYIRTAKNLVGTPT